MSQGFTRAPEECNVAAVIGNTVKIYGRSNDGFRSFTGEVHTFENHGQALEFATVYDDRQRGAA